MRFKILGVLAAVALVAACETAPEEDASASGAGAATSTTSSSASSSTTSVYPGSQEDLVVNVGDRVFFAFDRFDLNEASRATLEKQAAWLAKYPTVTITIEGHCDERGTREYNLGLGERRANATKDYLVALGVSPNRVKTVSYGEERPVAVGSNEAAWAQNRRAVSVVGGAGS